MLIILVNWLIEKAYFRGMAASGRTEIWQRLQKKALYSLSAEEVIELVAMMAADGTD